MGAADVRAGVAKPFEYRDGARGPFEASLQTAVRRLGFLADRLDERRGGPAPRRQPLRHALGRAPAEHVDVAQYRDSDAAFVEIALQLRELSRVPPDLRDCEIRTCRDFLFELQILIET